MTTKVKPIRLQITGTPQVGDVPTYVSDNCFCWGQGGGGGNMQKCVYDPNNCNADAFDYCNFSNTPTLGTAAACNTGTSSGNVPVLDSNGKLATSTLPGVALTDTFTVTNASDLTTLTTAQQGDIGIVTSENKTYVLSTEPYSTQSNWKELLTPTDAVTSVNGQTGAVCINVPTDNCQLSNGCGYITNSALSGYALSCDIPTDNCQLTNGCGYTTCTGTLTSSDLIGYEQTCNMVCDLVGADNLHYPSAKAVSDALSCAGAGDMLKSIYDPNNCNGDAFNYCNFYNRPTIPTDNCQLSNSCGYITGISCTDVTTALGYTPYSNTNPSGYTTCTGTVVASDLTPYAKSCDLCTVATTGKYCDLTGQPTIPTDNCQLTNGCGYTTCTGTISDCAGVISALGYTPYSNSNPSGYTSCTGTLNGGDLKTVNSNCLVGSGNISITEFSPSNAGSTGDVLKKTAGGYERGTASGGDIVVSSQANNTLTTGAGMWAGTEANYTSLTKDNNTIYYVY